LKSERQRDAELFRRHESAFKSARQGKTKLPVTEHDRWKTTDGGVNVVDVGRRCQRTSQTVTERLCLTRGTSIGLSLLTSSAS